MNILVVTHKDGPNLFIENIVRRLIDRGHNLTFYSVYLDETSLRMFSDLNLKFNDINDLTQEIVDPFDFIFCPVQAINFVAYFNKYIFSFCNMNPKFDHVRGADFVFTLADIEDEYYNTFSYMPVGMTKNDTPVDENLVPKKEILIIDSGHFPFSLDGKKQAAEMILNICKSFPDYTVTVKPRWLKTTKATEMTHINKYHLYDVIDELCSGTLPANLNLLQEHLNLQKLIDESTSVVTLCTTAFLDVALRNKGLIVASEITNGDTFHLRKDYFDRIYKYAEESGCVVPYNKVTDYLPAGIICNQEFIDKAFESRENVCDKTIDVMEYVTDTILSKGLYPTVKKYSYSNYQDDIVADESLSFHSIMRNRMFLLTENSIAFNRQISTNVDWTPYVDTQIALCKKTKVTSNKGRKELTETIQRKKSQFIIANKDQLGKDEIAMGFYYDTLARLEKNEKLIKELAKHPNNTALNYYCGIIYFNEGDYVTAKKYLRKHFNAASEVGFVKYITDRPRIVKNCGIKLLTCCLELNDPKYINNYIEVLSSDTYDMSSAANIALMASACRLYNEQSRDSVEDKKVFWKKYGKSICKADKANKKAAAKLAKQDPNSDYSLRKYRLQSMFGTVDDKQRDVLSFKNKYAGKKAVIIGNGPSLKKEDLERLSKAGYITFGANKIYKIFEITDWRPDVYACTDGFIFKQNIGEILSSFDCDMFLNSVFETRITNTVNVDSALPKNLHYIKYMNFDEAKFVANGKYFCSGGSVTVTLLALAYFMGIREMYIIGCDHNYNSFQGQEVHSKVEADNSYNVDYFISNYIKPGEKIIIGDLEKAENGYKCAKEYLEKHGAHIYNATRGGKLEVFERVDVDTLV